MRPQASACGGPRQLSPATVPVVRCTVPRQPNFVDCGLFALTFAEKFIQATLAHKGPLFLEVPKGWAQDGADLRGGRGLLSSLSETNGGLIPFPANFLTPDWFSPECAGNSKRMEVAQIVSSPPLAPLCLGLDICLFLEGGSRMMAAPSRPHPDRSPALRRSGTRRQKAAARALGPVGTRVGVGPAAAGGAPVEPAPCPPQPPWPARRGRLLAGWTLGGCRAYPKSRRFVKRFRRARLSPAFSLVARAAVAAVEAMPEVTQQRPRCGRARVLAMLSARIQRTPMWWRSPHAPSVGRGRK